MVKARIPLGIMAANLVFNFLDVTNHISIRRIFNVAREESLPTWYASLQALLVSVTAWALWRIEAARCSSSPSRPASRSRRARRAC